LSSCGRSGQKIHGAEHGFLSALFQSGEK